MYKQCRLKQKNLFTYKWINERIAKQDEIIKIKNVDWTIDKIWHAKQSGKVMADIHLIG